jgi:abhydrolase domain-containing protein 12
LGYLQNITASVLIAHAENDWDIPDTHSDRLFQAFLEPHLPSVNYPDNPLKTTQAEWDVVVEQQTLRNAKRSEILKSAYLQNFGRIDEFSEVGRNVVLVKTLAGGHDYLGVQEGLLDIIGKNFDLL